MRTSFIAISSILTLLCVVPYVRDILRGKTKPRIVSWLTWTLLTAIATAGSAADHQWASVALTATATIESGSIATLGLIKHGKASFARFDIGCQIAAIIGLVLWFIFSSPAVAVAASVIIDFIAAMPTIKHAWQAPYEETMLDFLLAGVAGIFTLLAATNWQITAVAYPAYIVVINIVTTSVILARHKKIKSGADPELVKL